MTSKINLFLFDGGEAPSAAENGSSNSFSDAGNQTDAVEDNYGREPDDEQGEPSDEGISEYQQFKSKFKNEYQSDLQRIIDKRFKNSKKIEAQRDELRSQNDKYQSLVEVLAERYDTDELDSLVDMVRQDNSYWEQRALENGTTVEEERNQAAIKQQQRQMKTELDSYKENERRAQVINEWERQAQELKNIYPSFDLDTEVQNEKFVNALQGGWSVRDAYQYAHFDDIVSGAIEYATEEIKKNKLDNAEMRRNRPSENGTKGRASSIHKVDVNKMTKAEMEELDRRVLRGEKVYL